MENGLTAIKIHEVGPGQVKREDILAFEGALSNLPGAVFGDSDLMPLKHSFADGVYVREIFIPKGTFLTGKIHRHSHPNFLMKGEVFVVTEDGGREHLKAPMSMISKAGTKRAIYAIEDTTWVTVHVTPETDLKKIEDYVIAPTFDALDMEKRKARLALESALMEKNCLILALKGLDLNFDCLFNLQADGILLPFKKSIEALKENGIPLDGLYAKHMGDGVWHVTTDRLWGLPLDEIDDLGEDMVGTWVAVAIGGSAVVGATVTAGSQAGWFGDGGSVSQRPMESIETTRARETLREFGQTGVTPWGYNVNQSFGGPLGNYDMSGLETQGMGSLAQTLSMGNPAIFGQGTGELSKLLNTANYDPNNDGGVYAGLTAGIDRNTTEAIDSAKNSAAYMGNLYSSRAARQQGDIASQGGINKSNILAQLYQNFGNQKLAGASAAIGAGSTEQGMSLARIGAGMQYGALPRTLEDLKSKDAYNAWLTQRSAQAQPLAALQSVLGQPGNYGVQSVPIESPWAKLLNTTATTGANVFAQYQQSQQNQKLIDALGKGAPPLNRDSAGMSEYFKNRPAGTGMYF